MLYYNNVKNFTSNDIPSVLLRLAFFLIWVTNALLTSPLPLIIFLRPSISPHRIHTNTSTKTLKITQG